MIEFRLLGSMRVIHAGVDLELGRRQERCLLGLLALEAGRVVSTDRLVSLLWNDAPPPSARATLHSYVARLRSRLARYDVRLVTRGAGYVAEVDPQSVDVHRFSSALALAQNEADPQARTALLESALQLWHGPLMADVAGDHLRNRLGTQLEEQRLIALELWADAELAQGRHNQLLGRLGGLVEEHPARESLAALLMRARYAAGDVAGALAAFEFVREQLADQLGLDPGQELMELHLAILNRRPLEWTSARREAPPPRQLPPDVASFTGRTAQLHMLDDLVSNHRRERQKSVIISAIAGSAGVGKTTLAVHWAHRMSGRFPDGELYVNLRGFDPGGQAMSPAEAMRGFLDALQVPPQGIPAGLQAQTGLYRSLLAGKQVLVILDNARDAEQVRPLLPGSPGCLVLVTSRNQLTGLIATEGAHSLALGLLNANEARQLLSARLGEPRVTAEPEAVEEILGLCAGLPLALAIVAARAATNPGLALAALVNDLCDVRGSLDAFKAADTATDVRAVFSWSYRALSPEAGRLFRLLGVHPGPDISHAATVSITGWPVEETRARLSELEHAHMVTRRDTARWAFHDLLRVYAAELARACESPQELHEARQRMIDHYVHTAHRADLLLDPHRDPAKPAPAPVGVTPEELSDHDSAMGWYTREHPVLLTVLHTAADAGFDRQVWQLAWHMAGYFERRGHWNEWVTTQNLGLEAALRADDQIGQARAHRSLGRAYERLGQHDQAHPHLRAALQLYEVLDDPVGEAYAHMNLNILLEAQGLYKEALFHATNALHLYQAANHVVGQGLSLNGIGWIHAQLGDYKQALVYCQLALDLQQRVGHTSGASDTWDSIGYAHLRLRDYAQASDAYRHALELFRTLGDRYNEAATLIRLGDIDKLTGDAAGARAHWKVAAEILDQLGHPELDQVRAKLRQPQAVPPSA